MLDKKKCKGTHKYTFGLGCGLDVSIEDRKYGLGKSCGCFKDWLSSDKSNEYLQKKIIQIGRSTRSELQLLPDLAQNDTHWPSGTAFGYISPNAAGNICGLGSTPPFCRERKKQWGVHCHASTACACTFACIH